MSNPVLNPSVVLRIRVRASGLSLQGYHDCMDDAVSTWRRGRMMNGKKPVWGSVAVGMDHQPPFEDNKGERRDTFCAYSFEVEQSHTDLWGELGVMQKTLHELADTFASKVKKTGHADCILDGVMGYQGIQWKMNVHEGGIKVTRVAA